MKRSTASGGRSWCRLAAVLGLSLAVGSRLAAALPMAPDVEEVAIVNKWTPPSYPPDARQEKVGGEVTVRFVTDALGKVTTARVLESPDPRLGAAAVAAVKQWEMDPAVDNGQAVPRCYDVVVPFNPRTKPARPRPMPENLPHPAAVTPAYPLATPEGDYPEIMQDRRLSGSVRFHGSVTPEGDVQAGSVGWASHSDFVLPALASLRKWKFAPAKQGDLPILSEVDGEMHFTATDTRWEEVLELHHITLPDGKPPVSGLKIAEACDAVWPIDRLLAGESGRALVEFTVRADGDVANIDVLEATQPEFGAAARAAMERWKFAQPDEPPSLGPRVSLTPRPQLPVEAVRLRRVVEFRAPGAQGAGGADAVARLVAALQAGEVGGAKGLDEKLTPLYRVPPAYPAALKESDKPQGQALIEFIVDREGRARLPRIVSATRDEFGWAAATAVAQWIFRTPRRGGEPVDVKVRVPVAFVPPEE